MLADSYNILNRWKNYFSQLLNVHRVSDVRQMEIYTAEPLIPEPSPSQVEIAVADLKRYRSPKILQIPVELFHAGGEILQSEVHKLVNSIWSTEDFPDQWKRSITVKIYQKGDKTDKSNTQFYPLSLSQGSFS
jgi:hypothetical protein